MAFPLQLSYPTWVDDLQQNLTTAPADQQHFVAHHEGPGPHGLHGVDHAALPHKGHQGGAVQEVARVQGDVLLGRLRRWGCGYHG